MAYRSGGGGRNRERACGGPDSRVGSGLAVHVAICTLIRKMEPTVIPPPAAVPAVGAPEVSLADISVGRVATVHRIDAGPLRLRLHEMGFVPGVRVRVVRRAPLRDPLQVEVCGYHLSLRVSDARGIRVLPVA